MRRLLARLQAWLRREAYVQAMVAHTAREAYQAGATEGGARGFNDGYTVGRAHGELIGRQALASELQLAHGVGEGGEKAMTHEELTTLLSRQLH